MRKYRIPLVFLAVLLMSLTANSQPAQSKRTPPEVSRGRLAVMRDKLDHARGILEGITLERFDLVITNAVQLRNMNLTNAFFSLKIPSYLRDVTNFQNSVDGLLKAASKKDLEAATKGYVEVTRNCVQCHQEFRREQFVLHSLDK